MYLIQLEAFLSVLEQQYEQNVSKYNIISKMIHFTQNQEQLMKLTTQEDNPGGQPRRTTQEDNPGGQPRRTTQEDNPGGQPRRTTQEDNPGGQPRRRVLKCVCATLI